jgi:dienelactone hydrolase
VTAIIETTVKYARETLKVKKIGAAGFCFGGPYVVRQLAAGKGADAGFIAHPGAFTNAELKAIKGPLAIAAAGKCYEQF